VRDICCELITHFWHNLIYRSFRHGTTDDRHSRSRATDLDGVLIGCWSSGRRQGISAPFIGGYGTLDVTLPLTAAVEVARLTDSFFCAPQDAARMDLRLIPGSGHLLCSIEVMTEDRRTRKKRKSMRISTRSLVRSHRETSTAGVAECASPAEMPHTAVTC
jgi:hypothetical protein